MGPMHDRMFRLCRQLAATVAVASVAGCLVGCLNGGWGGEPLGNYHPGGLGEAGASSGSGGTNGSFGSGPNGEPFCGTLYFGVASVQRDILVGMDRWSSRNEDSNEMNCPGGCGSSSKWALLSAAIDRLVAAHPSVSWGLALFGSDDACGVTPGVAVDVAQDAASSIEHALAATTPGGDA